MIVFLLLSISFSLFFIFGPCIIRKREQNERSVWGAPPFRIFLNEIEFQFCSLFLVILPELVRKENENKKFVRFRFRFWNDKGQPKLEKFSMSDIGFVAFSSHYHLAFAFPRRAANKTKTKNFRVRFLLLVREHE